MNEMTVCSAVMIILAAHELPAVGFMQSISNTTLATEHVAAANDAKPRIGKTRGHLHRFAVKLTLAPRHSSK
ncbi:hypothetical protein [Bradyrhizobium sp. SZCCHNS1054]|uniref:hypothetical protein n=1 Tax=Bradyrhizobium sp. SZCCHNS1054 TaxID=3057301 RepID=UPI002916BD38|nr:hypothetical protein [Bradyrhizobium sp. SZCCHNS1054]